MLSYKTHLGECYCGDSHSLYLRCCKTVGIKGHPERYPSAIPEFFINFLTNEGDLVCDLLQVVIQLELLVKN